MAICSLANAACVLGMKEGQFYGNNQTLITIYILLYRQYIRRKAVTSVGQRELPVDCPALKGGKLSCRGKLHDTILDWEHELPTRDLGLADIHSK